MPENQKHFKTTENSVIHKLEFDTQILKFFFKTECSF